MKVLRIILILCVCFPGGLFGQNTVLPRYTFSYGDFGAANAQRDSAIQCVLNAVGAEQISLMTRILNHLDTGNSYPARAHATACALIGKLRYKPAIPVLIRKIEIQYVSILNDLPYLESNPPEALIAIGKSALKPLQQDINQCRSYSTFRYRILILRDINKWNNAQLTRYLNKRSKRAPGNQRQWCLDLIKELQLTP